MGKACYNIPQQKMHSCDTLEHLLKGMRNMKNIKRFFLLVGLLVLILTLSWYFGMHTNIQKAERLLQEKYGMVFRSTEYHSRWFADDVMTMHVVDDPDLKFSVILHDSGEVQDDFLESYTAYRVSHFFKQLADDVGLEATFQGFRWSSDQPQKAIELSQPLPDVDPIQIIKDNTQWVYVSYILIAAETSQECQESLEKFRAFLEVYQQRYPEMPAVQFNVIIGSETEVQKALKEIPHHRYPGDYREIFGSSLLMIKYQNGPINMTNKEIEDYFLSFYN